MARPLPELSLTDWAVLAVVAERPTHGWAVARELAADGALGRVWTVRRPLVYRSLATLVDTGLIAARGAMPGERGPRRTIVRVTPAGRAAVRRWLDTPVDHVRDVRTELLLKLALLERTNRPWRPLVDAQLDRLAPVFDALRRRPRRDGFDTVLLAWRRESALAVERFLRALR